jgi:hypothetical protein
MSLEFDRETIERFRALAPRDAFQAVRDAVYGAGGASSDDFLDAYEQLVEQGILDWEQIAEFERAVS